MQNIPHELVIHILSFISIKDRKPLNNEYKTLYTCNALWKDDVYRTFGPIKSNNFYKEYEWQLKLRKHKFFYQRQWTLGCLPKIIEPVKEDWPAAPF